MNNRTFTSVVTTLLATATLLVLLWLMAWTNSDVVLAENPIRRANR
jgi:hypothetical protein